MAIVKATYTRNPRAIAASLRYYTHRPTIEGARGARELFGEAGTLTKPEVYRMIAGAKRGTYFYRLVLSPDPNGEDREQTINLKRLTRRTLARFAVHRGLSDPTIPFAAVAHTDHTDNRHVHVIACFSKKLTRADLYVLRRFATEEAQGTRLYLTSRHQKATAFRRPDRPLTASVWQAQGKGYLREPLFRSPTPQGFFSSRKIRFCPACRFPVRLVWRDGKLACQTCGYSPKREASIFKRAITQDAGLEQSLRTVRGL